MHRWTQIFLDEYDVYACMRVENAVSKRHRVFEVEDSDFVWPERLAKNDAGNYFYVSEDIHNWLTEQKPKYNKEVTLDFAIRSAGPCSAITGIPEIYGFMLSFLDRELAMMFKLAWGGE